MMTYAERLRADRRLVLLRLLSEQMQYRSNSSVLTMAMEHFGHAISRDQVRTELGWLAEQELISLDDAGTVLVATLTTRGLETAQGRVVTPGVARPSA